MRSDLPWTSMIKSQRGAWRQDRNSKATPPEAVKQTNKIEANFFWNTMYKIPFKATPYKKNNELLGISKI